MHGSLAAFEIGQPMGMRTGLWGLSSFFFLCSRVSFRSYLRGADNGHETKYYVGQVRGGLAGLLLINAGCSQCGRDWIPHVCFLLQKVAFASQQER